MKLHLNRANHLWNCANCEILNENFVGFEISL